MPFSGSYAQKTFFILNIIVYIFAIVTGIIAIVKVDEDVRDNDRDILTTCDKFYRGFSGNKDCLNNFNGEFAVAIVAFVAILLALLGLLTEIGLDFMRSQAMFLFRHAGRALYIALIAVMTLGIAGDMGLACGISCLIVATFELIYGLVFNRAEL